MSKSCSKECTCLYIIKSYFYYSGGPLDGPENGPAPGPWDIPAQCKKLFKDEKRESEVPHTATTKVIVWGEDTNVKKRNYKIL